MVSVDTSVWVAYFRGTDPELVTHLQGLLDQDEVCLPSPVQIEILSGCSRKDMARLRPLLSALPLHYPPDDAWDLMLGWVEKAAAAGERFGFADLLIASIAAIHQTLLWSLDRDFARMEKLRFLRLYRPAAQG